MARNETVASPLTPYIVGLMMAWKMLPATPSSQSSSSSPTCALAGTPRRRLRRAHMVAKSAPFQTAANRPMGRLT